MEVIDLTSPPISVVDLPSDVEPDVQVIEPLMVSDAQAPNGQKSLTGVNTQQGGGEARTKKKRTKKRKSAGSTPAQSTRVSRANSEERANEPLASTSGSTNNASNSGSGRSKRKRNSLAAEDGGAEHPARRMRRDDAGAPADTLGDAVNEEECGKDLFFVDLAPAPIPAMRLPIQVVNIDVPSGIANANPIDDAIEDKPKLLVPAHVTVLGSTPVEIIQPLSDGEVDEDFIDYLDFDDTKVSVWCMPTVYLILFIRPVQHITRYYDEAPNEAAAISRTVCKNCGAEGDHKTSACTVMIVSACAFALVPYRVLRDA